MKVALKDALSKGNTRLDVSARFTSGISTNPSKLDKAVERILGLDTDQIISIVKDIIMGRLRLVVANRNMVELSNFSEDFILDIERCVEPELGQIGMELINMNVTDIRIRN